MTELEGLQLKKYSKYLRLSCERDLYTIPQAAFRLNVSRNEFKQKFIESGLIKLKVINGKLLVPASEIKYAIDQMRNVIHKKKIAENLRRLIIKSQFYNKIEEKENA